MKLKPKRGNSLRLGLNKRIRKRIADGKLDAKEQAQAEAQRLDKEAKETLADAEGLLAATLAIDDRIDWESTHPSATPSSRCEGSGSRRGICNVEPDGTIVHLSPGDRAHNILQDAIWDVGVLQDEYRKARDTFVPLRKPDGTNVHLSPGAHNTLQDAIVHEMGPRFAPGSTLLYVGDTASKHVVFEQTELAALNVPITQHDKLPDVVLYWKERNWLFLIEAVTSSGPVSPKRYHDLETMLANCTAERVYVTAFLNEKMFRAQRRSNTLEVENE